MSYYDGFSSILSVCPFINTPISSLHCWQFVDSQIETNRDEKKRESDAASDLISLKDSLVREWRGNFYYELDWLQFTVNQAWLSKGGSG